MSELVATTFSGLIGAKILEIGDGYRAKLDELGGDGPIFLRAGLLTSRGIEWGGGERFRSEAMPGIRQKLGFPGDTMVTTKGNSIGRAGYVPHGSPPFVYSPHLSYWRSLDHARLSSGFLRYWVRSPEFLEQLSAMAGSTDMAPYLSLSDQRRLRVSLPEIGIQEAIGAVLGALDEKIVINGRIAQTSYDISEAQYRQLVVNATHTASVGDLIELRYGKALPATERIDGRFPVYGSGGVAGTHDKALVEGPGIVVGRKGTVGVVYWSEESFFPIDTTFYVERRNPEVPMEFSFYMLKYLGLDGMNSDSAVPGLNRSNALALQVKLPDEVGLRKFHDKVRPHFVLREAISNESASLAKMRDALLPKLMSGEIRVRDAERVVEDVTL